MARFQRNAHRSPATSPLVVGLAAARLTRLITTDWLGEWAFVRRAKAWAGRHEGIEIERRTEALKPKYADGRTTYVAGDGTQSQDPMLEVMEFYNEQDPFTWQAKLVKGLDCPFCVGFWIGLLLLAANTALPRVPIVGPLFRLALNALALNYVVGHVASRIDR